MKRIPLNKKSIKYFVFFITVLSCKKECVYDADFLNKNSDVKPSLLITSNNRSCNELLLKGIFYYHLDKFNIRNNIYLNDSTYLYTSSKDDILFDFSAKKRMGVLRVNDTLKLPINYFMDIKSNEGTFRLFKIDDIGKFHELDLSIVFVANYNYGIVGSFITARENENWYAVNYEGYIPNEKYFFSIFQPAELL